MTSHADTAITYAQHYGWAVHPVNTKKQPITKHGRDDATRELAMIRTYFKNGAQIGVATGPESGLFVLDVDLDADRGINGYETLAYLESVHGVLPHTPQQRTGRGGMQYLFKYVDGLKNSAGKIGAGIDTRGQGGYIVVAPSHNTNGPYEWVVAPDTTPLADVPQWLIDALHEAEQPRVSATASGEDRVYALKMLGQAVARVATASDGQKHDTLLKMARWMGGFVPSISETEIESALFSAIALRAEDERGARKTIQDGIAYGKTAPLSAPAPRQQAPANVDPATGEIREYVVPAERPNIINALTLRSKEFPKLVWTVDGLIPEGLCMLAGKPKSKKSWLALGIAVGVASGGRAFNYYDVTQGRVLYLDLESNQRRMKSRLQGIISDRESWPANFDIATDWKRGAEGIALLDGYCEAHSDTRLIVIDIWARFRPSRDPKADAYEQDYNALQELNAWAESRNVTVIVIHHTRKAKSEDVFEEISGTTGIVGAVATALILTRSPDMPDEQLLHMTGRDLIIDEPIALKWDNYTCQHVFVATGAEASSSAERRKILAVMEDEQEYHLKDLAAAVGKSMKALDNHLRRLMDDHLLQRTGRGRYAKIPQLTTELSNGMGNVGYMDKVEYMDKVDSLVTKHSTSDQGRGIAHGIGLEQQNAANPQFHESHGDSIPTSKTSGLIDRLKNRGARVLSETEVNDLFIRDNPDTTFSRFTGTPADPEDDHATEG